MAHCRIAVACSRSKPSSPSLAPASQPAESQESFNLDNVSGSDEPAQVDRGDKIKVNDPDAITLPKVPTSDVLYFFDKSAVCWELTTLWVARLNDGAELKVTDPEEQQGDVEEEEAEGEKRWDKVD